MNVNAVNAIQLKKYPCEYLFSSHFFAFSARTKVCNEMNNGHLRLVRLPGSIIYSPFRNGRRCQMPFMYTVLSTVFIVFLY